MSFNPKASPLAGRSPSVPDAAPQEPIKSTEPDPQPAPSRSGDAKEKKEKKERRNFYSTPSDHERTEAARKYTMGFTDYTSYTAFVEAAVNEKTRQLEAQYNDGRPWV